MNPEVLTELFLTEKSELCFGDATYLHLQVYSIFYNKIKSLFYNKIIVEVQSRQMTNVKGYFVERQA